METKTITETRLVEILRKEWVKNKIFGADDKLIKEILEPHIKNLYDEIYQLKERIKILENKNGN